ncbi:MAG TPA: hypothetical protein VF139_17510 [Candidatus Polarisedimenticolaceae bacterium]
MKRIAFCVLVSTSAFAQISDCDPTTLPPGTPRLMVEAKRVHWSEIPCAIVYDLVAGDLRLLTRSGGDYALATKGCVANDAPPPGLEFLQTPEPGAGFWLLVRGVGPAGPGTYNTAVPTQVGDRDIGISASPNPCP